MAGEQVRWKETVETLTEDLKLVIGNIFIAASSVSYYGPFTGTYREELVEQWMKKCETLGIIYSEKYNLFSILAD